MSRAQIPRSLGAHAQGCHKMMAITHFDLSLKELGEISRPGGMAAYRQSGISFLWTLLPVFDVYVLNIFTPYEHLCWNFSPYEKLLASEVQFVWSYRMSERIKQTNAVLSRLIKQAGHKKKSDFALTSFGNWTCTPDFNPNEVPTELRYLGGRHWSMVVPKMDRNAVQRHFEDQAHRFGDSALLPYPDNIRLMDTQDIDETMHGRLLALHIRKTDADDRAWLYEEVRKYESADAWAGLVASLDSRFAIKGIFNLSGVPSHFVPFVDMEQYAEVLRFRIRVVLAVCPLPRIEGLASFVRMAATVGEYPNGMRDELLAMLDAHLEPYRPIIDFEFPSASSH
jgi:hypothetical protein